MLSVETIATACAADRRERSLNPMSNSPQSSSSRWNTPTKFLVALVGLVLLGWLLLQFQSLWGPMIAMCILAYLLSPAAGWVSRLTRLAWGPSVTIVYVVVFVLLLGLLVVAGVAIQRQIVGLYNALLAISGDLPGFVQETLSHPIAIGPLVIDPATIDIERTLQPLISAIQPALSQTGTVVGSIATTTATSIGWFLFVFILSYYLLADVSDVVQGVDQRVPEVMRDDVRRLALSLGPIWNNYLRGQITLSGILGLMVGIALSLLGVSYAPVLGLLAFILDFIPYVGATISFSVGTLVALFQGGNWLGVEQVWFAVIVAVTYFLLQQVQGYVFWPRIMGGSLNLHPIVILIGALVMAQLVGPVGLVLAGPLVATLLVFGRYAFRKLFDLDPWENMPTTIGPRRATTSPLARLRWAGLGRRPMPRRLPEEEGSGPAASQ
jgi:predicted PurR-regulated permease PerM